ncbi:MAG: hypothetical protein R3B84_12330 [Zavarzinella sp.]
MFLRTISCGLVLLCTTWAGAQDRIVSSRGSVPSTSDLDRLNLVVAWKAFLPVQNRDDGIAIVQTFGNQLLVQMKSGTVCLVQGVEEKGGVLKAGDIVWTFRPAVPKGIIYPGAANKDSIFIVVGQNLFILDRRDGRTRFQEELPSTISAGILADDNNIYLPMTSRKVLCYSYTDPVPGYVSPKLPDSPDPLSRVTLRAPEPGFLSTPNNRSPSIAMLTTTRPPFVHEDTIDRTVSITGLKSIRPPYRAYDGNAAPSIALLPNLRDLYKLNSKDQATTIRLVWELQVNEAVKEIPAILKPTPNPVDDRFVVTSGNNLLFTDLNVTRASQIRTEYMPEDAISAPYNFNLKNIYSCGKDSSMTVVSTRQVITSPQYLSNARPEGRATFGGFVLRKPVVTKSAVYAIGTRWGMLKMDPNTLQPLWGARLPDGRIIPQPNNDANFILAVNPGLIYALDRQSRLVIIDNRRGRTLGTYSIRKFSHFFTNEQDDRLYAGADNGLLMCFHDKAYIDPVKLDPPPMEVPQMRQAAE